MIQIFAGLFTEGTTDMRFLSSIVKRTIEKIAFECSGQFEIELIPIIVDKTGLDFNSQIIQALKIGTENYGISMLCVQADADSKTLENTYETRINPALEKISEQSGEDICKVVVALVPIQETEAWMLADKNLFKRKIGTNLSDNELGINRQPESIAHPKEVIEKAMRIAVQHSTRRKRRNISIAEIYLPIGQEVELETLGLLKSYINFKENVINAFRLLNYRH